MSRSEEVAPEPGTDADAEPVKDPVPQWRLIWAVRAVPALLALGALDLLQEDPPTWFLVLTLVRLALGLLTLVALRRGAREEWCLAYVVVVFLSTVVYPRSAPLLLAFSAAALVMTAWDHRRRRARPETAESPTVS